MSRLHPAEQWFSCDQCGHFSTVCRTSVGETQQPVHGWLLVAAAGLMALGIWALRKTEWSLQARQDADPRRRLIEVSQPKAGGLRLTGRRAC